MKKYLLAAVAIAVAAPAVSQTYVPGYIRSDGTYVSGHYRSAPNSTTTDNYSTRGNVNPYTGQAGTVSPYTTPAYKPYEPYKPYTPYTPYTPYKCC